MSIKLKLIESNTNLRQKLKQRKEALFMTKKLEVGFFKEAKYNNGVSVASVAFWQDFGTAKIPPRPFFRNALSKNRVKWASVFKNEIKNDSKQDLTLLRVGEVAKGDIVNSIAETNSPPNAVSTVAKKGSSKPLVDTSFMRSSVNYKVI